MKTSVQLEKVCIQKFSLIKNEMKILRNVIAVYCVKIWLSIPNVCATFMQPCEISYYYKLVRSLIFCRVLCSAHNNKDCLVGQ